MAVITGTSGNDTLADTSGDDTINGLGGNDTINGGSGGSDVVNGGDGRDSLQFMTATSAVVVDFAAGMAGTTSFTNIEKVVTGDFNDQLTGDAAAQNLTARAGADTLWGAGGFDTLWGGSGADTFIFREMGTANADSIGDWTSGQDTLLLDGAIMAALGASGDFTAGDARFWASSTGTAHDADDRIIYETDTRQIWYDADGNGAGARQLIATLQSGATLVATDIAVEGGGGSGPVVGTAGDDTIRGTEGDDTIDGLGGNDLLFGHNGADVLRGGEGNDTLWDADGASPFQDFAVDTLDGGFGDDVYNIGGDGDVITDAGGIDTVVAWNASWTLGGGLENLVLADTVGTASDGTGNELDNRIDSASEGGELSGLGGNDTLIVENAQGHVVARGGDGDDTLLGGHVSDDLSGDAGSDVLVSNGGFGALTGGSGADTFLFNAAPGGDPVDRERITDFASGSDTIQLDASVMSALGSSGHFSLGDARFAINSAGTAQDSTDRVIYNHTNGQLWYDADGNGSGARQLIATLEGAPPVSGTAIEVINGSVSGAVINGTEANDALSGTSGNDTMDGRGGDDRLDGLGGRDLLIGGDGNDVLHGLQGEHTGTPEADTLDGGLGNDSYVVNQGDVVLSDPGGIDEVVAIDLDWTLSADLENLVLMSVARVHGTGNELDNVINGWSDAGAVLDGRGGNDLISGSSAGSDELFGGEGNDTLDGVNGEGTGSHDVLHGGAGDDRLFGSGATNTLLGDDGNDFLRVSGDADRVDGGAGNDTLEGVAEGDTLTGGAGADSIVFWRESGTSVADAPRITDFASGTDAILLDNEVFLRTGSAGAFGADDPRFWAAPGASAGHDADDRVVYDTASGTLWYDRDGSGLVAARVIAVLEGAPELAATDIVLFGEGSSGPSGVHLVGTDGDDTLIGTDGDDMINGLAGHDRLDGGNGADSIVGGDGNDLLSAGDGGLDRRGGDGAIDTLDGGMGDDVYWVSSRSGSPSENDVILPDSGGVDTVNLLGGHFTLGAGLENLHLSDGFEGGSGTGNELDNVMSGAHEGGTLHGMGGNDRLGLHRGSAYGGEGNDTLSGDDEVHLDGGAGNDLLNSGFAGTLSFSVAPGAANADVVTGFTSNVDRILLDGNAHANTGPSGIFADSDARFWSSTTGTAHDADDRVVYNTTNGQLWYDADGSGAGARQLIATLEGAPTLVARDIWIINGSVQGQVINGTSGADTLADTAGNDTINGLAGNDTINGGHGGTDVVNGGDGRDSLAFMTATSAVVADFVAGTAGNTTFTNIERVITGDFNDTLTGNAAAQNLTARSGADTLAGGGGVDTQWGGAGNDTFIFRENGTANADVIGDWTSGSDELALDNSAMGALGADGAFVAGDARFWSSSTGVAHDANDRVIYNTSNGQLYYDFDGNGSGAAQLIATFTGSPTVAATDISVI